MRNQELEKLEKLFTCPKCKEIFKEVNGLLVSCARCGFVDDSNFNQITHWDRFNELRAREKFDNEEQT